MTAHTNGPTTHVQTTVTPLQWRLHALMADRGIRSATELHRRLNSHGLDITSSQLTRIVKQLPERLNTRILATLMTVLDCEASELLRRTGSTATTRRRTKGAPDRVPSEAPQGKEGPQATPPTPGASSAPKQWDEVGPSVASLAARFVLKRD